MSMYSDSLRAFLKPVLPYLDDEAVSEIMINGPEDVWIEKKGKVFKTDARFSEEGLLGAARNMAQFVGRMLNDERPRLDARLPDGSRIHVVIPPIARKGTTISIRKFFKDKLNIDSLINFKSITPQMARVIDAAVHTKLNIIVAGGTGSGKTTLLNCVSSLIPDDERILTIEDSAELQLNQSHLVPFESRPPDKFGKGGVDMGDLLHSALRLRPDRIVVGEVRGGEAFHLMQAMNTGHGGSLATTHANTPTDTLRRLESLCLMSSIDLPMVAVRAQVASAINMIICCERLHDGSRKTTHISEVLPLNEKGEYRTQDLFVFTPVTKDEDGRILGYHAPTGIIPNFVAKARAYGFSELDETFFDPATYGVPAPPQFHVGEDYTIRWAPSLKHRERGEHDPKEFEDQWSEFEQKLKTDAKAKKAAEPVKVAVPANAPVAERPAAAARQTPAPVAKAAVAAARPAPDEDEHTRPVGAPAAEEHDDDKTPPPTVNPFANARPPARPGPNRVANEAKVEVSDELLADAPPARSGPPVRRPMPSRPGAVPTRRPAPVQEPALDDEEEDALANLEPGEKTMIKPIPRK